MKKFVYIMILLFTGKLSAQEKFSIQDVLSMALENNNRLKQSNLREDVSAITLKEIKADFYPRLNARSSSSLNFGRNIDPFTNQFINKEIEAQTGGVYFELPVFSGLQKVNEILLRKHELDVTRNSSKKLRDELTLSVLVTYLNALQYKEILNVAHKQVELTKAHLEFEKKLQVSGYKTIADVAKASVQVSKSEIGVIKARHQLEKSFRELCLLMSVDLDTRFELVDPDLSALNIEPVNYSMPDIFPLAVKNSGALLLANSKISAAEKAIDIAKSRRWPKINLVANIHSGYSSEGTRSILNNGALQREKASYLFQLQRNFNQSLGVNISIPILNPGGSLGLKKLALNLESARLDEANARNELYFTMQEALTDCKLAEKEMFFQEEALSSSKLAFEAINKRYNLKLVNSFTFAESLTTLYEAEVEFIKSKYTLLFKRKVIDFYLAKPMNF